MLCPLDIFLSLLFFRKDEKEINEPSIEESNLTPLHSHLACEGRENEVQGGRSFVTQASPSATPGRSSVLRVTSGVAAKRARGERELVAAAKPDRAA